MSGDALRLALSVGLAAASLPSLVATGYLGVLTALSGRTKPPPAREPTNRFAIVVPAHDEEAGIAATVQSLLALDYPRELFRVVVVADNCSDATALRARSAGATVLERTHATLKGKGYALAHAFEQVLADGFADAVAVVDADTVVSPNLLRAYDARFALGARAVQAEYGVSNPNASWRTRLMVIALALFHVLRSQGRERLGVSAGLRGNGMAFATSPLREVPHDAFSIVEDLEYGIRLGRAGHRVWFASDAKVLGEMVASEKQSRSQRTRWEAGRFAIAKAHAPSLLRDAVRRRSLLLFDLAMDVLVPPLTYVAAIALVGSVVATVAVFALGLRPWVTAPWLASLAILVFYVLRGVALAGVGARGLLDLAWAPMYMVWKIVLSVRQRGKNKGVWVRTAREGEQPR